MTAKQLTGKQWRIHPHDSARIASLAEHPVRKLFDAGVPIILNTDDPALFECTLESEYDLAARSFGFTAAELDAIAGNSLRYAFSGPTAKP